MVETIIVACGSAFIAGLFSIVSAIINRRASKAQAKAQSTVYIEQGLRVLLHDRLRYLGQIYLAEEKIDLEDRANLLQMHEVYHNLGGNGNLDELIRAIKALPLKQDDVFKHDRIAYSGDIMP